MAGAVTAYINFMVLEPVYEADTTLLITGITNRTANSATNSSGNTQSVSFEDIIAGQTLVSEYSAILKSARVISAVIKNLNDKAITEEELRSVISISAVNDTRIIDISVMNGNPAEAAKLADSVANVFSQEIVRLYKIENVDIIDKAEVPKAPVAPTKKKNIAMALAAAFIFAVSIVFLIEYLDNSIKNSEDVEKYLKLTVIGSIPVHSLK
jgi:capsular polysaccharide biosynthesis protein